MSMIHVFHTCRVKDVLFLLFFILYEKIIKISLRLFGLSKFEAAHSTEDTGERTFTMR